MCHPERCPAVLTQIYGASEEQAEKISKIGQNATLINKAEVVREY